VIKRNCSLYLVLA